VLTTKVMVIDDEPGFCNFVNEVLKDSYDVLKYSQTEQAISQYEKLKPDIVLLDINMPDINGYDLCREIKATDKENESSVIFISGYETDKEWLKSFEAGGDHFIAKPVNVDELLYKVQSVAKYLESKKTQVHLGKMAQQTAFSSMEEASTYGIVLQFLKRDYMTQAELTQALFDALRKLGLRASMKIQHEEGVNFACEGKGSCSPIEMEVFGLLENHGRLYSFGSRMIINDREVSLLIKNMPIEDDFRTGLLRDVLAVAVEGFRSRMIEIWRKNALQNVVVSVNDLLGDVSEKLNHFRGNTVKVMDNIHIDVSAAMKVHDFSELQEEYFASIVEEGMVEMVTAQEKGAELTQKFGCIIQEVEKALRL